MNREQVDQLLRDYLENKGRYEHLSTSIADAQIRLMGLQAEMRADIMFATAEQDGMPKPKGTVSRPTENMAVKLADGYETMDVSILKAQIDRMRANMIQLGMCVAYVDAWLAGLTDREQWVVRNREIDKNSWPQMVDLFRETFSSCGCSKDTLKRIRDHAMSKIYRIAMEEE